MNAQQAAREYWLYEVAPSLCRIKIGSTYIDYLFDMLEDDGYTDVPTIGEFATFIQELIQEAFIAGLNYE